MSNVGHPRRFVDSLRLFIRAGRGGNGYPKYGGIGGKGGDIYVEGIKEQTLSEIKKQRKGGHWKAENGECSKYFRIFGRPGKDLVIPAPCGTLIETDGKRVLGEILTEGDKVMVARGGAGGHPDNQFGGQKGEMHHIHLLLKIIADVGLVGFPNAGKSTFLRAISYAKPKVASYPFTTLHPTVGVMKFDDSRQVSVADLPGLIEGSWCNTGMGHKFLRHVERTKLLLFVVDVEGFRLGPLYPHRSPIETIILLNKELELYQPELVDKPSVLLINKMDTKNSDKKYEKLKEQLTQLEDISLSMPEQMRPEHYVDFSKVLSCSAKFDANSVEDVKQNIREIIDLHYNPVDELALTEVHDKIKDQLYTKTLNLT